MNKDNYNKSKKLITPNPQKDLVFPAEILQIILSNIKISQLSSWNRTCKLFNEIAKDYISTISTQLKDQVVDFDPENLCSAFAGKIRITPRYFNDPIIQKIIDQKRPKQIFIVKKSNLALHEESYEAIIKRLEDQEVYSDQRSNNSECSLS